ncbi:hypothetical protein KAT95_01105 [Candidatus Parcubacteria bacterium]|nr:hypothetical protein [Candidatus Parcubacteria bacterium]
MTNILLTNKSLKGLIKETPLITEEQRKEFLDRLPYLDEKERIGLLKTLKDIILLDTEKEEAVKGIKE